MANQFPYLAYIAWNVVLGYDKIFFIEGNAWTDVSIDDGSAFELVGVNVNGCEDSITEL